MRGLLFRYRLGALLLLNLASPVSAEILRVDINDPVDSPTDTASGFTAYTLLQETLAIPPFTIELNPSGGADLDDVHRPTPLDSPGLTLAPLFRDAAFVAPEPGSNFYRVGLDALITGLVPGKRYAVTAWSFDSGSSGARSSDWSVLGLGGPFFGVNNYTFDGSLLPIADTTNQFTIVGWADLAGRLTLRGRQSAGASVAQLFLNGFTVDELPDQAVEPAVVLAIDFNDRSAAGVDNTLPGFQEFLLSGSSTAATTTRTFGSYTVTLTATNAGAVLDDRLRTTPTNSGPFTEQLLLRDFVFAVTPGSSGLDARIAGLVPGRQYLVEVWSFDATSSNLRTVDWTLNGGVLWDDYQFDGANAPATNDDYKMVGVAAADATGELLVGGRLVSGSTAVFLNALRISELAPAAIVDFGKPIIAEFMAENDNGITDADGDTSDWIEIWNSTPAPLDLAGWHLTDDPNDKDKWTFPSGTLLAAQARLIVWASGKNRRADPATLHTNFALNNATGAYLGLVRPNGIDVASEFVGVPRQRANISYGVAGLTMPLVEGYFENPTPGARNGGTVSGFVADTIFNPDRGFYSAPVNVQITCATPNAVIRYTTDGSEPTATSPLYPGGAGVPISTTTVLRAKAFLPPLAPTNADTHTYIFNAHVAAQPAAPAGWPATWGIDSEVNTNDGAGNGTVPADYEMDPQVVNSTLPGYGIPEALAALPALSIALDPAGFHSAGSGIHSNPRSVGDTWERAASIELINPDGSGFQERAGIRVHGNSSRRPYRMQKHSFRLAFRNIYGAGKLNYRFFDETKVDEFDKLVLRACFTDSWGLVSWDPSRYRPDDSVYFRDVWMKRAHIDMGYWATANNFVHLYINGLYWGICNPCERIDEVFCVDHFGGIATDWDIFADFNELKAGNTTAWNAMFAQAAAGLANNANYQAIQQQLDVVSFADYYLLHVHGDAEDWPSHNWYAIRNRTMPGDKWRWFVWDQEIVFDNHSINRIGATNANTPGALMQALRQNAEFRLLFADRAHRHLHNNGALSLAACQNRWQSLATSLDKAIVAESARWGDTADATPYGNVASKPLYTRQGDWLPTVSSVKNTYLPSLYNTANSFATIRKLRAAALYPNTEPAAFSQHGGNVPTNYQLAMTAPAGTIYYTLNGNDPREALTGNPVGAAYAVAIALTQTVTVKTRVRNGTEWSALTEAKFIVGIAGSAANLSIAEVHYHPALNEEEEFVELINRSAQTIDLTDVRFTEGIEFRFPDGFLLVPGARVLVVRNQTAFGAQYGAGLPIAGVFIGALDDNGEQLVLTAADGSEIARFTYGDSAPWPAAPDKIGRSLILRSANALAADPANWRSSVATGGNPGAADSVPFNGAPLDDLDRDALPALLEYTFGTSDTVVSTWALPTAQLETLAIGSGTDLFLTFTTRYNLAADHVRLSAEHSSDLGTWSSAPESVVFLGETIAPDGTARLKWRSAQPANLARPQEWFRLRATLVP